LRMIVLHIYSTINPKPITMKSYDAIGI
jgi:hypothetical protein